MYANDEKRDGRMKSGKKLECTRKRGRMEIFKKKRKALNFENEGAGMAEEKD